MRRLRTARKTRKRKNEPGDAGQFIGRRNHPQPTGFAMNESPDRLKLIFKARLMICAGFSAWMLILALMINPGVLLPIFILSLIQVLLNQPLVWSRLGRTPRPADLRISLYLDVLILTAFIHFLGGLKSGPLLAIYILTMLYGSVIVRPREGLYAGLASLLGFLGMIYLEQAGRLAAHPGLLQEPMGGGWSWIALGLTLALLFLLPAQIGNIIYQTIFVQQEELQKALERFQRLFDQVLESIMVLGPDQTILRVNLPAAQLFGRDRDGLIGKKLPDLLAPESADDLAALLADHQVIGPALGKNLRLVLPDGALRAVEISTSAYVRDPETATGVFMIFRDVTEKLKMEEELRRYTVELYRLVEERTAELEESRECYVSLFEKAAVPLCWLNPQGTLLSANRAFYSLTGMPKEGEGSRPLVEILDRETDQARVAHYLDDLRRGYDAPTQLELPIQNAEGKILWTEWFLGFEPLTDQLLVSMIDVTERRKAEQAWKDSEELYRSLVETSPDAIVLSDLNTNILVANQRAADLYGVADPKEFEGVSSFSLIAPEDRERAVENARKTLETGTIRNVEYRFMRKDGGSYPGEISASVIRDREGRPKAFIGMVRDVSKRKTAETGLRESELRYRTLFEESRDAIYLIDQDGRVIDVSPAGVELSGYTRDELLAMHAFQIYAHVPDREKFLEEVLKRGFVRDYEVKLKKKNGTILDCLITSTVRRDADGAMVGFQGVIRDVTDRKRAEAALRESEEHYRLLIETSPDAIILTDLAVRRLMANLRTAELFGFARVEDMPLDNAFGSIAPEDQERVQKGIQELLETGQVRNLQINLLKKDGTPFIAEVSGRLVRDLDGRPAAFLSIVRDITVRKRAETALRESEERYRALVETSPDGIMLVDLNLTILMANPQALKIGGFEKPEDLIGKNGLTFLAPEDLDRARSQLEKNLQSGRPSRTEYQLRRPDGSVFHGELNVSLMRDPQGKPWALLCMVRDVTESKQAEVALRESEERYRGLIETSPDAITLTDLELRITMVNRRAVELYRLKDAKEPLGDNASDYFDPEERVRVRANMENHLKGEPVHNQEYRLRRKDGTTFWGEINTSVVRDAAGSPKGFLAAARDISEKKAAAEALRKSGEQYRFLAENVSDLIFTMDLNLRYTYVNPAVEKYRGYTVEEALALPLAQTMTPASLEVALKKWREELANEAKPDQDLTRTVTLELEQLKKDGGTVWGEVKMTFLRDASGQPVGILGMTRDISERKALEKARAEFQEQLLQAERMAMAGQIAVGVAHEMNNPLTAIGYYAQALEKSLVHEPQELDKLTRIRESADRIQRLLSRLLNYTSLARAEFKPVDLNAVVLQVLDAISHELERRPQVKVAQRLTADLPAIRGAAEPLFHLLSNLVMNAFQALPEDRGKITISTRRKKSRVILEVKDTGVGIAKDDLARIFTPFFSKRAGGQGTGLGLAIVQEVANMHHAEVEVDGRPGKGAAFRVSFPEA